MKRQTQRLIPGGLNLLAPSDQLAEGDSLELRGFLPNAVGKLRQAAGFTAKNYQDVGSSVTMVLQSGGRYYYGASTAVSMITRDTAWPAWYIDSGYDGTPVGALAYQGFAWFMNRSKQRKDDGTTVSNWTPQTPTGQPTATASAAGGLPEGAADYYITFTNATTLQESNPSPVRTVTITSPNLRITISAPSGLTTDAQNTHYNVYRKDVNMALPYRVNGSPRATSLTFVDDGDAVTDQSSEYLIENRPALEGNHDAAPAARVMANQTYNGRIVVASSAANPNRIWYTNALQPWYFPGSGSANQDDANWVDVGTDASDAILAITVRPNMLVIYRERSIWRHLGDMGEGRIEPIVPELGIAGVRAAVSTSHGDYFVTSEMAVYRLGDWPTKLSLKIEPVLTGNHTKTYGAANTSVASKTAIGHRNGRLWVSYAVDPQTAPSNTFIYDITSERWFSREGGFACFLDCGQGSWFLAGEVAPGKVVSLDDGATDDGSQTNIAYQSAYEDQGAPDQEKTYEDLVINHNTQNESLDIVIRLNKGIAANDTFSLATLLSTTTTRSIIPLVYPASYAVVALRGEPIRGRSISVRIEGDGATGGWVEIESPIILHYLVHPRKAKSFESDVMDHGTGLVKGLYEVELDIDNADGQVTLQVFTDLPGGTMAARFGSGFVIAAGGRRKVRVPVISTSAATETVEGKLLRCSVKFSKASPGAEEGFFLYGMRARLLVFGEYVDGTIGEIWDSEPIAVGV